MTSTIISLISVEGRPLRSPGCPDPWSHQESHHAPGAMQTYAHVQAVALKRAAGVLDRIGLGEEGASNPAGI